MFKKVIQENVIQAFADLNTIAPSDRTNPASLDKWRAPLPTDTSKKVGEVLPPSDLLLYLLLTAIGNQKIDYKGAGTWRTELFEPMAICAGGQYPLSHMNGMFAEGQGALSPSAFRKSFPSTLKKRLAAFRDVYIAQTLKAGVDLSKESNIHSLFINKVQFAFADGSHFANPGTPADQLRHHSNMRALRYDIFQKAVLAYMFFGWVPVAACDRTALNKVYQVNTKFSQMCVKQIAGVGGRGVTCWRGDARPYGKIVESNGFDVKVFASDTYRDWLVGGGAHPYTKTKGLSQIWSGYMCADPWRYDPRYLVVQERSLGYIEKAQVRHYMLWRNASGDNDTETCISVAVDIKDPNYNRSGLRIASVDLHGHSCGSVAGLFPLPNFDDVRSRRCTVARGATTQELNYDYTFVYMMDINGYVFDTALAAHSLGKVEFPEISVPGVHHAKIVGWICYLRIFTRTDIKESPFMALPVSDLCHLRNDYVGKPDVVALYRAARRAFCGHWAMEGFAPDPHALYPPTSVTIKGRAYAVEGDTNSLAGASPAIMEILQQKYTVNNLGEIAQFRVFI